MTALLAAYSFAQLAELSGLSRHQVRRLVDEREVETIGRGRKRLVPLTSFRQAFPALWDSIVARAGLAPRE